MLGSAGSDAPFDAVPPDRLERARVDFIASFLGPKNWLIPSWALVSLIPFLGPFPYFGKVAAWRLAAVILLYLAAGAAGEWLRHLYRRDPADTRRWRRRLTLLHGQTGIAWGLLPWLLWVPGNSLNHAVVLIAVIPVMKTYATARTTFWSHYLAGVGPVYVLTMLRLLSADTIEAPGLAALFTATLLYTFALSNIVKRQTDSALVNDIAKRDMANELRAAHDEALRKRHEAEAANAAKTAFLANMSHELRTPLNAIIGFSEVIAGETFGRVSPPRYRNYAKDINASGCHLLAIIDDILDIARIESGRMAVEPVPLDPRAAIAEALREVAPRIREKHQHLSLCLAEDAPLFADARAFRQVVVNLVGNATKFTQEGGAITVRGNRAEDGGFTLSVEDNGPGIAPSLRDRVFEPFSQIDNRYEYKEGGTGLGLSLVHGLVQVHGGRTWIESEAGAGARVHASFPPDPEGRRASHPADTRLSA